MKRIQDAWKRWKAKNWDRKLFFRDYGQVYWSGFESPPLRAAWDQYGPRITKISIWLAVLIAGGLILKVAGL